MVWVQVLALPHTNYEILGKIRPAFRVVMINWVNTYKALRTVPDTGDAQKILAIIWLWGIKMVLVYSNAVG